MHRFRRAPASLLVLVSWFLTGCATTVSTGTARTADVRGSIVHPPVIANLKVESVKVTGEATMIGGVFEQIRVNAVRDALAKSKADVLVSPAYTVERTGARTTVTVTGYPGTYTDFRPMRAEDRAVIDTTGLEITGAVETGAASVRPPSERKSGSGWLILPLLGVLSLI